MAYTTEDNSFFNEYLQPKNKSPRSPLKFQKKCKQLTNLKVWFGVNTCASILSCMILLFLCVSGLVIYTDVSKLLIDAKGTLNDLNVILPEVHTTMTMLQKLCNTPEFKTYCYPEDTNSSVLTII
tara:strand:+ start:81 stop:455 length:375 start_codon:yes stop_codon:yes gene_type:complete